MAEATKSVIEQLEGALAKSPQAVDRFVEQHPEVDLGDPDVIDALAWALHPPASLRRHFERIGDGNPEPTEWLERHFQRLGFTSIAEPSIATLHRELGAIARRSPRDFEPINSRALLIRAALWTGAAAPDFSLAANCCYENPHYACLLACDLLQAGARLDHHERGAPSAGALFVERVYQAIDRRRAKRQPMSAGAVDKLEARIEACIEHGLDIAERGFARAAAHRLPLLQRAVAAGCDLRYALAGALLTKNQEAIDWCTEQGAVVSGTIDGIPMRRFRDPYDVGGTGKPGSFYVDRQVRGTFVRLSNHDVRVDVDPQKWSEDDVATLVAHLRERQTLSFAQLGQYFHWTIPTQRLTKQDRGRREILLSTLRKLADILIAAGADPCEPENFVILCEIDHANAVREAIERGADLEGMASDGRLPINSALECDALDVVPLLIEAGCSLAAPQRTVAFHPQLSRKILPALAYVRSKAALELILKHAGPDETSRQALLQRVPTRNPPPKAVSMAAAEAMGIARSELNTRDIAWSPNQLAKLESFVMGPPLG